MITKHHYVKVHVHTFYSLSMYYRSMSRSRGWGVVPHYTLRYWKSKPVCSLITGQKGFSEVSYQIATPGSEYYLYIGLYTHKMVVRTCWYTHPSRRLANRALPASSFRVRTSCTSSDGIGMKGMRRLPSK